MVGKLRAMRSWRAARSWGAASGSAQAEGGPVGGRTYAGWFIAMEGGDGAGKSTQLAAVADWLRGRGYEVVTTREPGATPLGSVLRNLVLHAEEHKLGARAEALLFAADRADHMETVVRPALERGAIVLTDRHVDSSVAYQSGGRGLKVEDVVALSAFATEGVRPDLVVLLDLDPAVARARREERTGQADKLEAETGDFHARVRATFLARAKAEPARYLVVDANQAPRILTGAIQDRLDQLLPPSASEAAKTARRTAEREAAIAREREFRAAQAAAEQAKREAAERVSRERQARELAERQAAEQERLRQQAEQAARAEAEARERAEQEWAEATRLLEQERLDAERLEQERKDQAERDAVRRREQELAVRQAEARAKERARLAAAAARVAPKVGSNAAEGAASDTVSKAASKAAPGGVSKAAPGAASEVGSAQSRPQPEPEEDQA